MCVNISDVRALALCFVLQHKALQAALSRTHLQQHIAILVKSIY